MYIDIHKINITIDSIKRYVSHSFISFTFYCNFTIFFSLKKEKNKDSISLHGKILFFLSLSFFFKYSIFHREQIWVADEEKLFFEKQYPVNLFYAVRKFLFLTLPAFPMDSLVDSISYNRFSFSCSCSGASVINSLNLAATCFHFTRSAGWNSKVRSISRVEIFIHVFRDSSLPVSNIWIRKLNRRNIKKKKKMFL